MSHDHWCYMGQHYLRYCSCPSEMPVNKACAKCIANADRLKDQAVQEALEKIIDVDTPLGQP
jgi:hypothetical protein